ncbi:hypothetical protein L917_20708 [Phytophthora nicotianae]|uniref:Uncharacterized protein n=4 Tax=Phytophthora nicotianae TaxID=4792 RepID=V9DYT5_PHYNI|nr:hypothetical protein F443_21589 [Phytophthora nicotianae P1569]ETL78495.1 hypothetical protein L917_20708 [Phytophthora nicotianae]ETO60174.1 hypothetical protein F444_21597 [Phytophthora nicotianae P1976]
MHFWRFDFSARRAWYAYGSVNLSNFSTSVAMPKARKPESLGDISNALMVLLVFAEEFFDHHTCRLISGSREFVSKNYVVSASGAQRTWELSRSGSTACLKTTELPPRWTPVMDDFTNGNPQEALLARPGFAKYAIRYPDRTFSVIDSCLHKGDGKNGIIFPFDWNTSDGDNPFDQEDTSRGP